ncbi:MAG TPA: NADH-quinone oxidoreductase subunit N [Aggregatilineales bacterium]|nr:NADH-quinone oxidoreductase subunit N [Aggregatilineales bacterium]
MNIHLHVLNALPALSLALGASVLFLLDTFIPKGRKAMTAWLAVIGVLVSLVVTVITFGWQTHSFSGMFIADSFTALIDTITLITAFISILLGYDYLKRTKMERGEYYPLMLLSASGAMFMGAAGDLVVVFVALELLSIPLYIMAAFRHNDARSEEAAMKYFLLGAFSTGFLVYGIALVYGACGTTDLQTIFARFSAGGNSSFLLLMGSGLLLVGLGFKVAAVPFHMWTPDVYQGSPTPVTSFMSVAAKVGGFGALLRVMTIAIPTLVLSTVKLAPGQSAVIHTTWQDTVTIIAALTMILGNFVAISQKDIKRLLAYSSIAHAGYIMMAVAAAGTFTATNVNGTITVSLSYADYAVQGALFYLLAYMFTNLGAFGVAIAVERDDASGTLVDDFAGLGKRQPMLAIAMVIFMLSLIGIPLTAGFVGKWYVFLAAVNANLAGLALIGVLTSIISAYYYLRVVVKMWLEPGESDARLALPLSGAVALCAVATLVLGIAPFAVNLVQTVQTTVAMLPK